MFSLRKIAAPTFAALLLTALPAWSLLAAETGAKIPEYPVLFVKGLNTVQNPDDPILLPTFLASSEVDYECELVVVIGKLSKK